LLLDFFFFGMLECTDRPWCPSVPSPPPPLANTAADDVMWQSAEQITFPRFRPLEIHLLLQQTLCLLRVHVIVACGTGLALIVRPLFAAQFLLTHG